MNINYLFSIITLYLNKEKEVKTNLQVIKKINNKLCFKFSMPNSPDETSFSIPYDLINKDDNLQTFIKMYKKDLIIIDEKYKRDKLEDICNYYVTFNNGRKITFENFTLTEINDIRNIIYDIKFRKEEIRVVFDEEPTKNHLPLKLHQTGFASYKSIIIVTLCFLVVFILSLWFFVNL